MKKSMVALLASGVLLTLAGCCCEKSQKECVKSEKCHMQKMCHKKHHHTPKSCAPDACPQQAPATETATETVVVEAVGD